MSIGELCEIQASASDPRVVGRAQVVGFQGAGTLLNLMGSRIGLSREMVLVPTGRRLDVEVSDARLGSVMDPSGREVLRFAEPRAGEDGERREADALPPPFTERAGIRDVLATGVRAIDSLLTCGVGQRIGIFASAGCGKTTLMNMLIDHSDADVYVIGLIGERGREVTEFVETLRQSPHRDRCVLVYATSDFASVDRCNAALVATAVAEYFRDQGRRVVLFVDSLTRYARALRDVALAAGEMPARRGYPASVFDALPALLERPGNTAHGSITAFYTVLLENEDEPDPVAEEIKSILDGHIRLSRKLAGQGHFPAIDMLASLSRVATQIIGPDHREAADEARRVLARLDDMQWTVELGEYRPGENHDNDRAMALKEPLMAFLRQSTDEAVSVSAALEHLSGILA
ncbi:putative ATP synthase SpaL [Paludibacterium paludis]|uniref:ATP synthase SpaL n=1 Tax=Paludibacterium paludis TaxID=1225769 RepID=A0A918UAR0_9NEIS|nr:putative ATP synthase SpaL [Paludibacterium paludis]